MDEKPFRMGIGIKRKRMTAVHGSDKTYKEQTNRESCSLVECASAAGDYINPTIIWRAKSAHRCGWYKDISYLETEVQDWWFGYSNKGYNTKGITLEWLQKVFEPETRWTLR